MERLVLLAPLFALAACGGPQTPGAKAAHERHEHFEALGKAFKRLGDELRNDAPDIAKIKRDAAAIDEAAGRVKTWFPAGSGPQDGVNTHARKEVWTQTDAFGHAAAMLADAAGVLQTAAQSRDLAAVRGAIAPLGGACKGCHDRFRRRID